MPDAAKGVRQLVLLHGRTTAREMVEPEAESKRRHSGFPRYHGGSLQGLLRRRDHNVIDPGETWIAGLGCLLGCAREVRLHGGRRFDP